MANLQIIQEAKPALMKIAGFVLQRSPGELEAVVESEIIYLQQRVQSSEVLAQCTPESLLLCIRHSVRDNLSLDENAGLVYIYPQNVKTANGWIKVAKYEASPNGKISLCRQTGNLLDHKQPVIAKDGSGKITGGHIELLKPSFPDPRWETISFDESHITRWRDASTKKNKGKTNPLYSNGPAKGIDEGFMKAKIVKHALKNLGLNPSEVRGQQIEEFDLPLTNEEVAKVATDDGFTDFEEINPENL